jgi:hypothetical protein
MRKLLLSIVFILALVNINAQVGIRNLHKAIISSSVVASSPSSTLIKGLLGGWKFDETTGNAVDVKGTYTGTSTAVTYTASGKLGRCFTFNGTTSKVSFGNVIKPTNAITISAWVKTSNTTTDNQILGCHYYSTAWQGYYLIVYSDGAVGFFLGTNTAAVLDMSTNPIYPTLVNNGAWHHIVATWNGTTAYIYVDNIQSTGTAFSTPISYNASNSLYLGYDNRNSVGYNGDIDMTYIWNRAFGVSGVDSLFTKENTGTTYPW